jgi:smad nuclear-interacting protein 1
MLGQRYPRSASVSAEDDLRYRRERPRYPPRERDSTRDRKRDRAGDSRHREGDQKRRRRSFSPVNDNYDYDRQGRRNDHRHRESSRRTRSHTHSPPPLRSKPTISRRSRSPKDDAHRRSSPYRRPQDSALSALEKKNPTSTAVTTAATANANVEKQLEKQKPNYAPTGLLAAETNTVNNIVLKYNEPPEARKPPAHDAWRLYVFKGSDLLDTVHLGERSSWLFGRERQVVDFPVDHPSCSKQHAVIQFRFVERKNEFGDRDGRVRYAFPDITSQHAIVSFVKSQFRQS